MEIMRRVRRGLVLLLTPRRGYVRLPEVVRITSIAGECRRWDCTGKSHGVSMKVGNRDRRLQLGRIPARLAVGYISLDGAV